MLKQRQSHDKQPFQLPDKILGKSLPASQEAEKAVLGALLLDDIHVGRIAEIISPEDFYYIPHQLVFQAILSLSGQLKRIDIVTLQDELLKQNSLEKVGGVVFLISLQEDIPALGLLEQHATMIKEKSVLRELIRSAAGIINECYTQNNQGIDAVLDNAEKTIFQIANRRADESFVQLNIWLKKTFQHLSSIKSHAKGVTGVPTGYEKLDEMTSGFQKGDLIVVAGRPSMGKTGIALGLAASAAAEGATVGFFSLEMPAEQLSLRLLSSESGIGHHNIRNASITSDEWIELTSVAARLADMKLFIDDTAMLSLMDLRAKARKLKAEHNLQLLVIDYLQLIHSSRPHENRHQEVSEISRSLKALAKELEIPIIALSQLSRAVDSRMDKRPMLSDLRESGAIEQDADLIMFLYRDVVYNPDTENPDSAELIIGKQRNGPTGTVYLHFVRELTKFVSSNNQGYK
ncbi:replicative DNA helicase [Candidatus Dependentiae bacterium]|nr:replicative DNA helicase [Candidatus Dependentiae bacterium]MCC7414597.1 replicative DNA helicase [Campylobacterota bacterium]